ncbi:MAG: hypothetical protein R2705_17425 [Ilumatobacteraceae bacterium]
MICAVTAAAVTFDRRRTAPLAALRLTDAERQGLAESRASGTGDVARHIIGDLLRPRPSAGCARALRRDPGSTKRRPDGDKARHVLGQLDHELRFDGREPCSETSTAAPDTEGGDPLTAQEWRPLGDFEQGASVAPASAPIDVWVAPRSSTSGNS